MSILRQCWLYDPSVVPLAIRKLLSSKHSRMTDTELETLDLSEGEASTRKLRLFTRGSVQFAISENEIAAIEKWRAPAPLPNAPDSVLGVVGIQGRMLTVLDLSKIVGT